MINYQKWLASANGIQLTSWKALNAGIVSTTKAMGVWLTTTPAGWATMAGVALAGVVLGVNAYNKKQEELREEAEQSAQEIDNQSKSLDELKQKYIEICDSTDDEATKTQQLNDIKQELVDVYGFEKDALKELNDERERGLDLLDGEFEKKNRNSRNNWLEDNKDTIKKANEEMASNGVDYFTTYLSKNNIASSILELFDKQEAFGDTGYVNLEFDYTDTADRLNKLKNIYNEILDIQSKRSLTADEKQLLSDVKTTLDFAQSVYDKYYEIYSKAAKYNVENIVEDYLNTDEGKIENVGKDTFKKWSNGLLAQAENAEQKRQLEALIENQFPDLTKYFDNLDKAYNMFGIDVAMDLGGLLCVNDVNEGMKKAFINTLSDEDLEIATKIPDLFADGLDGATKKIEAWKKQNPIETEVKITIGEALEGQTNNIKAITSAMEDMSETGYITSETYAELAKLGGNFTDCLEWENGKLKLNVDKLKDLEIQQLATAKSANSLAISELELKAASLASHGQDFSDIQAQIESLMKENAVYTQLMEEIANAKPDEGSSTSEEPESVTQFKKALAEKEHLLNTNQISEQEYYEWLDSESKRVYGNLKDYEEDLWKYDEQVYKWRQEQEEKLFDKKIENYKKLSDNAIDKYIDGNGNELTVNASFDYARSQINSAIAETQNRINELSLKTGFEDEIEELKSDLEDLYDALEDINKQEIESQKEYIETLKDEYSALMDEQIDQQKKLADEIEKSYENRIDTIDKQIEAINKVNEAEERQKKILEAQKDVKEAQKALDEASIKNRVVLTDYGWEARADEEAIKEAQEDLAEKQEALDKAYQDEQIAKLEEQKELLETQKDNSKEYYDKAIEDLESQKEAREKQYDILVDIYEQLGGDKKQTSLNESLVEKLTSNGDINKAVQGLTPTEMKQAITSGILTTDSNGNYTIDYSILDKNEQAVKDNTETLVQTKSELEKLNNSISGSAETMPTNVPKNLDSEGYLIGTDGKRVLHDGKPIKATTKSEWEKKHTTDEWTPNGKNVDKITMEEYYKKSTGKFAGYDTMMGLLNAIMTGEYTIPTSTANSMMNSNINSSIGRDITKVPDYINNNINNAPVFNQTFNIDGDATDNTVNKLKNAAREVATEEINNYFQYLNNTMQSTLIKSRYQK